MFRYRSNSSLALHLHNGAHMRVLPYSDQVTSSKLMKILNTESLTSLSAAALLLGAAINAKANSLTITQSSQYSYSDGGEFTVTSNDAQIQGLLGLYNSKAIVNGGFEVFCLEYNQSFYSGASYSYAFSDAAIPGGVAGGVNGRDPVSLGSAWLYSQFAGG